MSSTMELLIQGQMENFVKTMAANGNFSEEQLAAAMAQVKQQVADLDVPAAPKRTRTVKVVEADDRCMARVWGGGCGTQCKSAKCEGSDYCKRCAKLAEVTTQPLSFDENGKHIGLFWGRIDQPQPHFNDGQLVCQWKNEESKAIVAAALKEGKTFHPFSGEMKKKNRKPSSGTKKPRKGKKATKKNIASGVKRAKNAYMFFLGEKRAEVRAALVDESEDGKVAVSEVAKRVGALWKAMDETAKAPYTAMAKAAKEERDAEIAKLMEEASISEQSEESASIDDAEEDDESAGKPVTHAAAAALPAEVVDNEITKIAFQGIDDGSVEEEDDKSVVSGVTQATGLEELDQDDEEDEEDDGLEVEEHVLADGSKVLKSDDGTLYDESSFEEIGKWDEASNSLITA
mgnify:CR=1 FL=1